MSRAKSDLKVTASDALEFEAIQSEPPKHGWALKCVVWGLAFVVLLSGGWLIFSDMLMRLADGNVDEVPLIRAADGPVKIRPENPGGLQIPNRDKLVYGRMQSGAVPSSGDSVVERLLPQPEEPLPRPVPRSIVPPPPATPASGKSQAERVPPPMALPTAPVPGVKDVVSVQPPPPLNLRKNSERSAWPEPAAVPKAPVQAAPTNFASANVSSMNVTPKPRRPMAVDKTPMKMRRVPDRTAVMQVKTLKSPTGRSFRVQLAAARTPEGAQSEWDRVRQKHVDLLGDFGLTVTKADLGPKKGVFYRLRVGPLANENSARALCKELSKRKMGCLVVKPGR